MRCYLNEGRFVSELLFQSFSFRTLVSELSFQNFGFRTSVSELEVGEPQTTGWGNPPPAGTFYERLPILAPGVTATKPSGEPARAGDVTRPRLKPF